MGTSEHFKVDSPISAVQFEKCEKSSNDGLLSTCPVANGGYGESVPSYEALGPAPAGERCDLCGKGGGVEQIRHRGRVNLWHPACADGYLAALSDPPVKVPDLPPDHLDEHGVPLAAYLGPSTNGGRGLSPYAILDLARWYEAEANRRRVGSGLDQDALDRDLRRLLAERGVFPEFIAAEFERVMQAVFPI
jgi:hypothetical protein